MKLSPIVLFLFNRPVHTRLTLNALANNIEAKESLLFIFCDGLRPNSSIEEQENIKAVRRIASEERRFKQVKVIFREVNLGLANSIINGVSDVINQFGRIIVLEDDIVPSIGFLKYMNDSLDLYENEFKVGCIHAWNYNLDTSKFKETTFFLKGGDCWGWGTWKRSWDLFNADGVELLNILKKGNLEFSFNRNGTHPFIEMLENQIKGINNSWAIRWHASLFINDKFCLHPVSPVVRNIGLDNSGTHCGDLKLFQDPVDYIELRKISVIEDELFFKIYLDNQKNVEFNGINRIFVKKVINLFFPSILLFFIKKIYFYFFKKSQNTQIWQGNFKNWDEAKKKCIGYDSENILEKCKNSLLKVKNGTAIYERDGVLFDQIQYSWGLLAGLQKAAIDSGGKLSVLDFGGSLGSSYFQNKGFLALANLEWSIVEQSNFIQCGKIYFQDDKLNFFYTIEECFQVKSPNVLVLSSVLQYLEDPYIWIKKFNQLDFKYIILDRTSFINYNNDILTVQNVPENIYKASYPSWFFNKEKVLSYFSNYSLISEFQNEFTEDILIDNISAKWLGMILEKKMNF
jgi:putative methyltransferase (TIGR04325 family)